MTSSAILYVVATPIGNLGDMVPRAVDILQSVDLIAAEDTRHSVKLMQQFDIKTPMQAYHDHSGDKMAEKLVDKLRSGKSIALISDAGTPLVSDPGYRLVDAAMTAGVQIVPIPGPSALIAALSAAGLPSDRFIFEGFLAAKQQARCNQLKAVAKEARTVIFYEAPHRLLACLADMVAVFGPEREVVIAREITKTYETIKRMPVKQLQDWVAADQNQQRGECVLLVKGYKANYDEISSEAGELLALLLTELPLKRAAAIVAKITGYKKKPLYQYGLSLESD